MSKGPVAYTKIHACKKELCTQLLADPNVVAYIRS